MPQPIWPAPMMPIVLIVTASFRSRRFAKPALRFEKSQADMAGPVT